MAGRPDAEAPRPALAAQAQAEAPGPTLLADALGGRRGILDSSLPAVVFVAVQSFAGLRTGVTAAVGFAALVLALRVTRKEPWQQAVNGFVGVALAALIAARTHSAEGFFLPGIAKNAVWALVGAVSLALRRPLAGYALAALDRRYAGWRADPGLRRAATWATLLWVAVFGVRVVVQGLLYLAGRPGWLAVANLALGWPLYALAIAATYALVRRPVATAPPAAAPAGADPPGAAPSRSPAPPSEPSVAAEDPPRSAAS